MKSPFLILLFGLLLLRSACANSIDAPLIDGSNTTKAALPRGADASPHVSWHLERTLYKKLMPDHDPDKPWPLLTRRWKEKTVFLRLTRRMNEEEGDEEDLAEELSVEVAYEDIYDTLVFLCVVWVLGFLCTLIGMPSLVGEICAGFLLGPPLADFVPFPEAIVLIGEIGLLMLLLEAGIEVDIAQLKETGVRSVAIALTGASLALGIGLALAVAAGESTKSAFAVGASFAPTSIGVASNALAAGNVLNTPVGQLIIAAGVIDDIVGLIILAMLEVVVDENASIFDYFIPIISSVGFLVVLGGSALTWMPRLIQKKIFPLFDKKHQNLVGLLLMTVLVMAYLPLLFYTKASYLTGAFLAGLTFSQIDSVHVAFVEQTHHIMAWLLRVFFAASIGFQVPIKMFGDSEIIAFGFLYYIAVLAKLPLGIMAPKFEDSTPEGFPYDPNKRDSFIVGLAMSCRGEFSFIIAAFALGEGLINAELYSSIVFAVLLSAITSPFALLTAIKYYNRKSEEFLDNNPMLKDDAGSDETIPLYLAVQGRTENQWGLQEIFRKSAKKLSLKVIDHRSWHPRGADAVVVTEMYVQDTTLRIHNPALYFKAEDPIPGVLEAGAATDVKASTLNPREGSTIDFDIVAEDAAVEKRIEEVRAGLLNDLGPDSEVVVSQWLPHLFGTGMMEDPQDPTIVLSEDDQERLLGVLVHMPDEDRNNLLKNLQRAVEEAAKEEDMQQPELPTRLTRLRTRYRQLSAPVVFANEGEDARLASSVRRIRQVSTPLGGQFFRRGSGSGDANGETVDGRTAVYRGVSQPILSHDDLWDTDEKAQDAAQQAVAPPPEQIDLTGGPAFGVARRRKVKSDLSGLMNAGPSVEDRLGGHVRRDLRRRPAAGRGRAGRRERQQSYPPMPALNESVSASNTTQTPTGLDRTSSPSLPTLGEHDAPHLDIDMLDQPDSLKRS